MGIQVFKQLAIQRAHVNGELRRLRRRSADVAAVTRCEKLIEAIDVVMAHQGVDEAYDRTRAVAPTPKREYFPRGAYRRDVLTIMRREARPLRMAEILDRLCAMHQVTLSPEERSHAAIKLAQGNDALIQAGLVVRASKSADYRSAACTYELRRDA